MFVGFFLQQCDLSLYMYVFQEELIGVSFLQVFVSSVVGLGMVVVGVLFYLCFSDGVVFGIGVGVDWMLMVNFDGVGVVSNVLIVDLLLFVDIIDDGMMLFLMQEFLLVIIDGFLSLIMY